MSRLVVFMIFIFVITSAVFADVDFNENIYAAPEKPVTKISDLGVTVATNEKDFHLVLKKTDHKVTAKPAVKTKSKKSSVKLEKKNPLTRRIASSSKRVQKTKPKK